MSPDSPATPPLEKSELPSIVHALHRLLEIVALQVVKELEKERAQDEKMLHKQESPISDNG